MMHTTIEKLAEAYHIQTEKFISLYIKPKPKYLPNFIWRKILSKLLILDEFTMEVENENVDYGEGEIIEKGLW